MLTFRAPDGTNYSVDVASPASSNAIVYFRHPDGRNVRLDRYSWYLAQGPEALNVMSTLDPKRVEATLDQPALARLFRRSMPVWRPDPLDDAWRSHTSHTGRD
jgi:hypothetical protein